MVLYVYRFTGFRVSGSFATLSRSHFKRTETAKLDYFVIYKRLFDLRKERIDDRVDILFTYIHVFTDALYDLGFCKLGLRHRFPHNAGRYCIARTR